MKKLFQKRIIKLREFLNNPDEAILINNEVNIGYFCGFFHSEGYLLVTCNSVNLLVDFRYFEAAQKKAIGANVICFNKLTESIIRILKG